MNIEKSTSLFLALFVFFFLHTPPNAKSQSADEFAYMRSVRNATDIPLIEEYDYIVIGGGTAGCPLAATLSERYKVLVLERGSDPRSYPHVLSVSGFLTSFTAEDDGKSPAQRFTSEDGVCLLRGRILGGSCMISAAVFSKAHAQFFNESSVQWNKTMVEKSYEWVEKTVVFNSDLGTWQDLYKKVLLEAGFDPYNGFTLDHLVGTKISGSTFDSSGRRHGAVELLNKANLTNLRVAIRASVNKILFSSSRSSGITANGVEYKDSNGKIHRATIRGRGEVLLSAGAIGSPQLLLLSGVGSKSYLSSIKIPVVLNHPYVGAYMVDNPRASVEIVVPFNLDPSIAQVVGITPENNIFESRSYLLPFGITSSPFGLFPSNTSSLILNMMRIVSKFINVDSYGSLRLTSATDVVKSPTVRFNYFSNPNDLARCVRGMRKIGDMLNTPTMDKLKSEDLEGVRSFRFLGISPPANMSDTAAVEEFCREAVTSIWHYHGGCVVGKVVDGDFRVTGINGLRVIDSSTFSVSPGTNPLATVMMMGRYMGLKMMKERSRLSNKETDLF